MGYCMVIDLQLVHQSCWGDFWYTQEQDCTIVKKQSYRQNYFKQQLEEGVLTQPSMNKVYDIKLQDNEWLVFVFFKMSCHAFQKNALAASSEDGCADVAGLPLYELH